MQNSSDTGGRNQNASDGGAADTGGSQVKAKLNEAAERTRQIAQEQLERGKQSGMEQLESTKTSAAERTRDIAGAVDRVREELQSQGQDTLANYAGQLASSIERFADTLRNKSLDQLSADAQRLARHNPALFVAGSFGLGFAIARFLKATPAYESYAEGESFEADRTTDMGESPMRTAGEWSSERTWSTTGNVTSDTTLSSDADAIAATPTRDEPYGSR